MHEASPAVFTLTASSFARAFRSGKTCLLRGTHLSPVTPRLQTTTICCCCVTSAFVFTPGDPSIPPPHTPTSPQSHPLAVVRPLCRHNDPERRFSECEPTLCPHRLYVLILISKFKDFLVKVWSTVCRYTCR